MVIMDRQDYINKANSLLNQNTYRSIPRDPTNPLKINVLVFSKGLKIKQGWIVTLINPCTPQVVSPQVLWPPQDPQTRYSTKAYSI